MSMTCRDVELQLTPYVDGELSGAVAHEVSAHLDSCGTCRQRARLEGIGRDVLQTSAPRLATPAPAALRAAVRRAVPAPRRRFSVAWVAASVAAMVIGVLGLVALAGVVRPVPVFAAQATLDHLKCVRLGPSAASSDPRAIEAAWQSWQGWTLHVPSGQQGAGMRLLGYRRCIITEGRMAHLLYERNGETVSLFVMADGPAVGHEELEMFGQDAVLWTSHGHTYALVGRGGRGVLAASATSLEQELAASAVPARSGF